MERSEPTQAGGLLEVAPGISAWVSPNGGWGQSNAGLVSGHRASLLVDTLWDLPQTRAMLAGFSHKLETAPIEQVVNTHSDGDHWFGNQLVDAGRIVSTRAAFRRMQRHGPGQMQALAAVSRLFRLMGYAPLPGRQNWGVAADYFDSMLRPFDFSGIRPRLPNRTFTDQLRLDVGGRRVNLLEVGPAHTAGDLVAHVPDGRIVFAGDILFQGTLPVIWDGSVRNWIKACERILDLDVDTVVPGHGPVTGPDGVESVRRYWQLLWSESRRHFERTRPAAAAALLIARSDAFRNESFASWDGQERTLINVHMIYRRLLGRSRRVGTLERLMLLRKTAILAQEFTPRTEPPPLD